MERAQLGRVEAGLQGLANTWWVVRNLHNFGMGYAKNFALGTIQGLATAATAQVAHPALESAATELSQLQILLVNKTPLTTEKRAAIAKSLETLLAQESAALRNSVAPNNTVLWFTRADRKLLNTLIKDLKSTAPLGDQHVPLIKTAFALVEERRKLQIGAVASVAESALGSLRETMGVTPAKATPITSAAESVNRAEFATRRAPRPPKPVRPENMAAAIEEQATLVKSNITKMALGNVILFSICGFKDTDQLTGLIDSANRQQATCTKDSAVAFKEGVYSLIDNSSLSLFRKTWAKFLYWLCEVPFQFYVNGAVDNFKRDAFEFISKGESERLNDLITLFITPTNDYLTTLSSFYQHAAQSTDVKSKQTEALLADYIQETPVGKRTPAVLNQEITDIIMERYIPSLAWTRYFFFQPIINSILRKTISGVVLPSLVQSSKASLGVGSSYLHIINQQILNKLYEIQDDLKEHKEPSDDLPELSLIAKEPFNKMIEGVFGVLDQRMADNGDTVNLTRKAQPGIIGEAVEKVDGLLVSTVKDTAKKQVAGLAQSFTQKEFLEDLLWNSLTSLNDTFKPNTKPTLEEMKETEANMFKALKELVSFAVTEAVEDVFDSSRPTQRSADSYVRHLQKKVEAFEVAIAGVTDVAKLRTLHDKLFREIDDLQKKAKAETNAPTMVAIHEVEKSFLAISEELSNKMKALSELENERLQAQRTVEALERLHGLLAISDSNRLLSTLRGLPLTLYPKTVQGAIETLKRALEQDLLVASKKIECSAITTEELSKNREALRVANESLQRVLGELPAAIAPLTAWAKDLKKVKSSGEESSLLSMAGAVVGPGLKTVLVSRIMGITEELFKFVGKEYNWDGLGLRVVDAYLNIPK
jgi:hypothetical protein